MKGLKVENSYGNVNTYESLYIVFHLCAVTKPPDLPSVTV